MRPSSRKPDELRKITIETNINKHAEGSCLISIGDTKVLCTATVEDRLPPWLKGKPEGWVTAEYGMLPRATDTRTEREAKKGQTGRTQEIQRLIGRALRGIVDLKAIRDLTIKIDCDVIQADGGTRCASIVGGYVALALACQKIKERGMLQTFPLKNTLAAVSAGIYQGTPILDLEYVEDSTAETDANFVMTGDGGIVEIQGTAEGAPFSKDELDQMIKLAEKGIKELTAAQKKALPFLPF